MHTWHWHTWQGFPYLTCSLLQDWPHGFFTQHCWPQLPADLVAALHRQAQVYRVKQVHGNTVLSASEIDQNRPIDSTHSETDDSSTFSEADGLFTDQLNQAVWVCTADCTPVLIADVETRQVAAVHAGWRGTAAKIVPWTIARLQNQGSQLQHLRIAMGPAIAGEVYQVSTTVAAQVGATVVPVPPANPANPANPDTTNPDESKAESEAESEAAAAILTALQQGPNPPILADPQPGRARLDVRRINTLQLEQIGIQADQIAIAPYCTYQTPAHFFSYRREKQKKVQWSGIVSR